MKRSFIQLNYLFASAFIVCLGIMSVKMYVTSSITIGLEFIGIFFIVVFGMKIDIFGAKIWYTQRPRSIFGGNLNIVIQIVAWLLILQFPANYSSFRLNPILGLILASMVIFPTVFFWKIRLSESIVAFVVQAIAILIIIGSIYSGIAQFLIKIFVNAPESTRFLMRANLGIVMNFLMVYNIAKYNNIRIIENKYWRKNELPAILMILVGHLILLSIDTGIWNHAIGTWKSTSMGIFMGINAGIIEEIIVRGIVLGWLIKKFAHKLGFWKIIILQTIIFSVPHILTVISNGSLVIAISVVISVAGLGVLWAIIYLAFGKLWIAMALHALWDIAENIITQQSNLSIVGFAGVLVALAELVLSLLLTLLVYKFLKENISINVNEMMK